MHTPGPARGPTSGFNPKKLQNPAPTLPFVPSRASSIPPPLALTPLPLNSVILLSSALNSMSPFVLDRRMKRVKRHAFRIAKGRSSNLRE